MQTRGPKKSRDPVPADLAAFIRGGAFPCVGAKAALARGRVRAFEAGDINCPAHDAALREALMDFADLPDTDALSTFACLFRPAQRPMSEAQFEAALWRRLQGLHDLDVDANVSWADDVSADPASPAFSMSIGGAAYFVVGLHPGASRAARRFSRPALIFNPHEQFRRLRADGRYDALKRIVRERETRLHGGTNPMLADFGEGSEARQYSGRVVGEDWQCPFRHKATRRTCS